MTTTSTTGDLKAITLAEIERVALAIGALPKPTEWMLISPDGTYWKGDPQKLFSVLAVHHPLLKGLS